MPAVTEQNSRGARWPGPARGGLGDAHQIHALAKLGELLDQMPKAEGGRPSKTPSRKEGVSTLAEVLHLKTPEAQKLAHVAQQLASLPIPVRDAIAGYALAKLGELLRDLPKQAGARGAKGGGTRGSRKELQVGAPSTYVELGIDKKTASIAQQLATLPVPVRDAIASQESCVELTTADTPEDPRHDSGDHDPAPLG